MTSQFDINQMTDQGAHLLAQGHAAQAINVLRAAIARAPNAEMAWVNLASCYVETRDFPTAETWSAR